MNNLATNTTTEIHENTNTKKLNCLLKGMTTEEKLKLYERLQELLQKR